MTSPSSSPSSSPSPRTLTARSCEDLIALAPVVLGFWPERSVVMLTFGAPRPFHGRIDLPPPLDDVEVASREVAALVSMLVEPARRHRARSVVLVYFAGDDAADVAIVHGPLVTAFEDAGIDVPMALRADGARWRAVETAGPVVPGLLGLPTAAVGEGPSHAYDVHDHPFVVRAVAEGRLAHACRADLVASVEPTPVGLAETETALAAAGRPETGPGTARDDVLREGRWVEATVRDLVRTGRAPTPVEAARLVWAMRSLRVRDAAWSPLTREDAADHVDLWHGLTRRTPDRLVAAPATLLAFAAWQAGDGALAWVALDRARRGDPAYRLAALLEEMLRGAAAPSGWSGGFDWSAGLV